MVVVWWGSGGHGEDGVGGLMAVVMTMVVALVGL